MKIKTFFLIECIIILGGISICNVFGYKNNDNVMNIVRINNNSNNKSIESNIIIAKDDIYISMQDLSYVLEKGIRFDKEKKLIRIARKKHMTWFDSVDIFNDNKELFYEAVGLFKKYQKYELKTNQTSIYFNKTKNNIDEYVIQQEVKDIMIKLNSICNVTGIKFKQCNEISAYIEFFFDEKAIQEGIIYTTDSIDLEDEISKNVYYKIDNEEEWYMFSYPLT